MRAGRSRAANAVLVAFLVVVAGLIGAGAPTAAGATAAPIKKVAGSVQITVLSTTPSVPTVSATQQPITFSLRLTNTTATPLSKIRIRATRGEPIVDQVSLDRELAKPKQPDDAIDIRPAKNRAPVVSLGAKGTITGSTTVAFVTTTGIPNDSGICLCNNWIDPIFFTADTPSESGATTTLGTTSTVLPVFFNTKPKPVPVSWVWPLIDRPHRLADTVFTDDELAADVNGGRLDNALQVIENVEAMAPDTPLTLLIDPELIDELAVMATGKYTVQTGSAPARPGTGAAAAQGWLDRLRTVLEKQSVTVELTPYADPDVQSLTEDNLTWTSVLPAPMAGRVAQSLDGEQLTSDIAWPAAGAIGADTLDALSAAGTTTVVLPSTAVRTTTAASGAANSIATLASKSGPVTAALTSAAVERLVAPALGTNGAATLPKLLAQIAVRADQYPNGAEPVVITAPRYVTADPDVAAAAIIATSNGGPQPALQPRFATATALSSLVASASGAPKSTLTKVPTGAAGLPDPILDGAHRVTRAQPVLKAMFVPSTAATAFETSVSVGLQRIESSAWRAGSPLAQGSTTGLALTGRLASQLDTIRDGVHIVKPTGSGSYTLASSNAPLPITVENTSQYAFRVEVGVRAVNDLPGFRADDLGPQTIQPGDKETLHIPSHVDRTGRIQVEAQLRSPPVDGHRGPRLGEAVRLNVHSTVLGTIGIVITIVAGSVLVLALVIRFFRRLRYRGSHKPRVTATS